jgi:hypothetical protein
MAAFGLSDEIADMPVKHYEQERFEIWKENHLSLKVFLAMSTQWDVNADGMQINLKYTSLPIVQSMMPNIPARRWPGIFNDIRIMESAALEVIFKKRQEQIDKRR